MGRAREKRENQEGAISRERLESECRAGFPACRFTELSSSVSGRATGKSPEPADRNVCPTSRFRHSRRQTGLHISRKQTALFILPKSFQTERFRNSNV